MHKIKSRWIYIALFWGTALFLTFDPSCRGWGSNDTSLACVD